ncbi:odorant receptor 59a-like [Schistocerca gregaria]|uniref:odorant receptor 59a-like n=1 Tax=Schistocerca gregaria TaxID=7010 RepID=UPI00211E82B6|nr:odorant receptor 59a-like [Schistocerca gregaria]
MSDTTLQSDALLGPSAAALSWLGLWRPPGGREPGFRLLGAAFVTAVNIAISFNSGLQMFVDTPEDPAAFREVFFLCSCCFSWTVRVVTFMLHRKRLQRMVLSLLDARERFPDYGTGVREKYSRTADRVWKLWLGVTVTVVLWMADPLIRVLTSPPGENGTRPLIFWLPVDVQHSPAYEITYAIQAVGIGAIGQTSILMDIFIVVLLIHAASELAVLNENVEVMGLSKLRGRANKEERDMRVQPLENCTDELHRSQTNYVFSGYLVAPEVDADSQGDLFFLNRDHKGWKLYNSLVNNIRHHQLIIEYVKDLEVVTSTSLYLLLLANALNVCLHSFGFVALFQEGATGSTVIKEVLSFPSFLGQTALYCFFGQLVIDQADRLQFSGFSCDWPQADETFRRSLRIFMLQAARPLSVRVGKLVTLSRNSFLQALNASYTIFSMLFNLEKRK